jgi:hypothetical protein
MEQWSNGVMERFADVVNQNRHFLSNTPTLQHSNTPTLHYSDYQVI